MVLLEPRYIVIGLERIAIFFFASIGIRFLPLTYSTQKDFSFKSTATYKTELISGDMFLLGPNPIGLEHQPQS